MNQNIQDNSRQGRSRLFVILTAICLPLMAALLLSGLSSGMIFGGELFGARPAEAASLSAPQAAQAAPGTVWQVDIVDDEGDDDDDDDDIDVPTEEGFQPPDITIQAGDTVRWTNLDDERHTSTSPGNWDSGDLNAGQSWERTFTSGGAYSYICVYHSNMVGSITVIGPTATPQATPTSTGGNASVTIQASSYQPQNVSIPVGNSVTWTNLDSYAHTVTSPGNFDSGSMGQGATYTRAFTSVGTFNYICAFHQGMTGSVTVTNGGGGTPVPTSPPAATNTPAPTNTAGPTSTPGGPTQVDILNFAFVPQNLTVSVGTTVRWTNLDAYPHTVTSAGNFDSGMLNQNQSYSFTFNAPGTYDYVCAYHNNMSGRIVVQAAATATPTMVSGQVFSDVFPTDYFYTPVNWLVSQGIVGGYQDGTFRPYNNATRGQVTKMVVLGEGWPLVNPAQGTFSDVAPGSTFYRYIETAVQHGVITGYQDGTFRPNADVTRGQLTKIVVSARGWSLANPPTPTFSDVAPSSTFYRYIETAVQHGILSGYNDGTFRPGNNAIRGQIAKILYNALTGGR